MKFTGVKLSGVTVGYEPEYAALLAYARSQSIPLPDAAQRIRDSLGIKYAKAQGIWSEADVWYKFRSNGSYHVDFACLNWKNPGTFTLQRFNSPTFGANGFTGNGTNMYLNSGWIPNTHGVNFKDNDAGVLYSTISNIQRNGDVIFGIRNQDSGGTNPSAILQNFPRNASNSGNATINANSIDGIQQSPINDVNGFSHIKRVGTSLTWLIDNSIKSTKTGATLRGKPVFPLQLLARNFNGTIDSFSERNIGLLIAGSSFNTKESAAYTWFNNYVA
jgi:hypothetical protein